MTLTGTLGPGDLVPRFNGVTTDGRRLEYEALWQRRNVVLFALAADVRTAAAPYLRSLERRLSELTPPDTSLVLSDDSIAGLPPNHVVIADRWGEIAHTAPLGADLQTWPSSDDVLEWVEFVRMKCPECPP